MVTPRSAGMLIASEFGAEEPLHLDRIYRDHAETVSRWIRRLWHASDVELVQDLLHEVFLVAQRRLPDFRGHAKVTTWLYAITVRVVSARRRKERFRRLLWARVEPELSLLPEPVETPLGQLEREHATEVVYAVLDALSERDRALLVLFELEALSGEEIAEVLGMSTSNVSVALHRARERFKKELVRRERRAAKRGANVAR